MQTKVVHRVCKCERILFVQNVFGIWDNEVSFCHSSLINNNLSLPCYTTFCSFIPHSSLALSFCNCQSYGSFFWQDNRDTYLLTMLSCLCSIWWILGGEADYYSWRCGSKRKVQRGKCFESKLWAYGCTLPPPSPPPIAPLNTLLFCCKVMSVPATTLLKGISLFHVGCFFLRRVLAVHGNQIHRGPGIHTVIVVIAVGKTFRLFSPLKS